MLPLSSGCHDEPAVPSRGSGARVSDGAYGACGTPGHLVGDSPIAYAMLIAQLDDMTLSFLDARHRHHQHLQGKRATRDAVER